MWEGGITPASTPPHVRQLVSGGASSPILLQTAWCRRGAGPAFSRAAAERVGNISPELRNFPRKAAFSNACQRWQGRGGEDITSVLVSPHCVAESAFPHSHLSNWLTHTPVIRNSSPVLLKYITGPSLPSATSSERWG